MRSGKVTLEFILDEAMNKMIILRILYGLNISQYLLLALIDLVALE